MGRQFVLGNSEITTDSGNAAATARSGRSWEQDGVCEAEKGPTEAKKSESDPWPEAVMAKPRVEEEANLGSERADVDETHDDHVDGNEEKG